MVSLQKSEILNKYLKNNTEACEKILNLTSTSSQHAAFS